MSSPDPTNQPVLTLVLPSLPPTEYSANYSRGQHWANKQEATQAAHDEIIAEVRNQGWHREPLQHARISVLFYLPDRRKRDSGGLIERFKPWLDALTVKCGGDVIQDDDLATIGWPTYRHEYRARQPGTQIEIYQ